jgi:hypothetical protein
MGRSYSVVYHVAKLAEALMAAASPDHSTANPG